MNLFKHSFPKNSVVSVTQHDDEVTVSVSTPRPDPVWLRKFNRLPVDASGIKVGISGNTKFTDEELYDEMYKLITSRSGYTKSYYSRLSKEEGGFGGSQERKEKCINRLISDGRVTVKSYERPIGRRDHELHPT